MGPDTDRPDKRRRDPDDRPDNARSEQSSLAIAGALAPGKAPVERQALGLPIKVAAAAGGLVLLAVVGGVLVLGGPSGPSPMPTEGTQAEAAPPLASSASIAPESAAPDPSAPALPPVFSGTYDVTAVLSSLEYLGSVDRPPPPGTTVDYRSEIDCGPAACTFTSGPLPRFDDNGPRYNGLFELQGNLPLADGGTGLALSRSRTNEVCDLGTVTIVIRLAGTNPTTSANQNVFGGFTGSHTGVTERLEGTNLETGNKCYTYNFVVDFVGTRVGG